MPTILIVNDYYLPGYRGGGPIRTLANTIDWLGDSFDFRVLTGDRDFQATAPYPDVTPGVWRPVNGAQVRYLPPDERGLRSLGRIVGDVQPDLLYVNSFFSPLCVRVMWARYLRLAPRLPVLLAPRDELNPSRLALKRLKKTAYLRVVQALGVYNGVLWQATNPAEAAAIRAQFPGARLLHARNAPARTLPPVDASRIKDSPLRVVFLSRVARSKNLSDALRVLALVETPVTFDIYGPREDAAYWRECEALIAALPGHVQARYCGAVEPEAVTGTFAAYDAFLFPTIAENYGHVIWEALYAGCLPVISDRTPWGGALPGWVHPLDDLHAFAATLDALAAMPQADYQAMRRTAHEYAVTHAHDPTIIEENRTMFTQALKG